MNKSKVTKQKSSKSKKKKDQPEVFVLPPNLLEQLGINLGSIETTSESIRESQEADQDYLPKETADQYNLTFSRDSTENHLNTALDKESSIIQTANLMKESVFLSPTFISNNISNIEGEFEVVGNNYVDKAIPEFNFGNCGGTEESVFVQPETSNSDFQNCSNENASVSTQDAIKNEQSTEDHTIKHNNTKETLYDEHADEAYSSDCSNSNMDKTDVLNSPSLCEMKQNVNKKINIISEQIIDPSQFKNTIKYSPKGNDLIPVTINAVIKSQYKNSTSYQNHVIVGPDLITDCLKSIEMFDGNNTYFPTEVDKTPLDANETVPEEIEINESINVTSNKNILIQKQNVLSYNNESLGLFTHKMQQNDDGVVHLCVADNVELSKSAEQNVLDETCNRSTAAEYVFEADKLNDSLEIHNEISSSKNSKNVASSLPNEVSDTREEIPTLIQCHIDEGTQKYGEEVGPAEDELINPDNSHDSRFIKNCNETNLSVDKEDLKLQYAKSSNDHISAKSITKRNIKNPVEESTAKYESKCTTKQNNVDKQDLKLSKTSSRDIISAESFFDKNTNTKIQLEKCTHKYNNQCYKLQNNIDKDDLKVKNDENSSDVMSTETIINKNTNTEILIEKCKDKCKKRYSEIQKNADKNDLQFQNNNGTGDVISTQSVVNENTNRKIQAKKCTDEYVNECSIMQKNVDNQDLKLSIDEGNSSDIMSLQSIVNKNTNNSKCTDRYKRKCSKIPNNADKRDLNLKNDKNSSSDVGSTESIFNKNTHTKIQVEKRADRYDSQWSKIQKTCDNNASKILSSENYTFRYDEREKNPKRLKSNSIENAVDVEMEKVKEIAKYLSQYANIQKRNTCNVPYDGNSTNNKHASKSKLSIQGVEKPGGSLKKKVWEKYKDVRTYERKNKRKLIVKNNSYSWKYFNISSQKINLSDENKPDTCKENERCVCEDFGRLISYDVQNTHENICFRNKNEKICTPNVVFSIYNEDAFSATSYDGKLNECSVGEEYIACGLKEIMSCNDNGPIYTVKESKTNTSNISEQMSKEAPARICSLTFDDSGEPPAKKHRGSRTEMTKEYNETKEEYAFENSRNIHVDNSSERVSEDPGINGTLVVHDSGTNEATPVYSDLIKCGVCQESMQSKDWIGHIESKHNYLAWKHGERALDFNREKTVREHLSDLMKEVGELKCTKCGLVRKYVKTYLTHIERCDGFKEFHNASVFDTSTDTVSQTGSIRNTRMTVGNDSVTIEAVIVNREVISCGVCQESMCRSDWQSHIESQHQYMAWKSGEPALDVNNEEAVREHLNDLTKEFGGLKCAKCGVIRKYVKSYLVHIQDCNGLNESLNTAAFNNSSNIGIKILDVKSVVIKCGVCQESMHSRDWQSHIESQHNYLAWESGDPALDLNNVEAVRDHLYCLSKELGGLKCAKCGVIRKYVKSYLAHIGDCSGLNESLDTSALDTSSDIVTGLVGKAGTSGNDNVETDAAPVKSEIIICGVCQESMRWRDWQYHIESKHHYMAWKSGQPAFDVNDEEAVRNHLYDLLKEFGGLKCAKCGVIRKYVKLYLTHIQSCKGPSESQNDISFNDASGIVSGSDSTIVDTSLRGAICDKNQVGDAGDELVKCGVCEESVKGSDWLSHIEARHGYLAWKHGEPVLDVKSIEAVHEHLYDITKKHGALKCSKCGLTRKYVKSYMTHIRNCNGPNESRDDSELNTSSVAIKKESTSRVSDATIDARQKAPENQLVNCGVCGEATHAEAWIYHIRTQHNYLAWKLGEPALDVNDEEAVRDHLYDISKENDGLECSKCGVIRRYVKSYLTHVNSCSESNKKERDPDPNSSKCDVLLDVASSSSKLCEALVKCGVCGQYMLPKDWMAHIADKHNYLAWKAGDPPLDIKDILEVRNHLQELVEKYGPLKCSKCGLRRKYVKNYMQHIKMCHHSENSSSVSPLSADRDISDMTTVEVITSTSGTEQIKCGVCGEILENNSWISHIADQHKYLAWKEGYTPLDVNDKDAVRRHLRSINNKSGQLTCKDCGKKCKLVKTYLQHIEMCNQDGSHGTLDVNESCVDFDSGGTCGVCQQAVAPGNWVQHTQRHHNYLAWREGEKPWDLDDFTEVNEHLYVISKKMNGLICNKCGLARKYVKSFLTHIKNCTGTDANPELFLPDDTPLSVQRGPYQCAMCKQSIEPAQWKQHAMKEHYNVTWVVGQTPIDVKNPYAVERYLKEYKSKHSLKCKCGATRVSCAGFYAHIITCGKSEEEIEMFKSICDICNNSYLCIYKSQHMAIHRVQEYNKELKLKKLDAKKKEEKEVEEITIPRKRRAAQKARSVLENYNNDLEQNTFKCESCGLGTEFREDLKAHKCETYAEADFSGESSSAEEPSGDDSRESSVDSDASADAEREEARKRHKSSATTPKVPRLPVQVTNRTAYLLQADEDFCNTHFTDDTLFPEWHSREHEMVSECDLSRYFPPIERSCKFKTGSDWITLERFEAVKDDGYALFTGACIVSIAWIPLRVEEIFSGSNNYLAVVCHNDVDDPRYLCDETPSHENLIQIWEFSSFMNQTLPKIVFGIAHDFGTVWSMDWCPSGARDLLPEDLVGGQTYRLGLLAVACSNGSGYIFSVPYPSTVVRNDTFIYKLKPVAQLRMTMSSTRKLYQATSITWSKEKGHKSVLVGYADGSTAYYDLTCDSPLLRVVENDVDVFFPYHDERPHNSSITATDMYPSALSSHGAAVAAGATGAELCAARRGAGGARARVRVPAAAAAFTPHWPAALLAGDVAVMNMVATELEWGGAGRRLGGVRAAAGCARCGAVLAAAPPTLRLLRTHPVYPDVKRRVVGMLELTRLDNKRQKRVNDELGIQIEPLTYADTVQKYGIEFRTVREVNRSVQRGCTSKPRAHCPERFPLADIKAMAFCPSWKYHNRLALATHSGLIFLMSVVS